MSFAVMFHTEKESAIHFTKIRLSPELIVVLYAYKSVMTIMKFQGEWHEIQ